MPRAHQLIVCVLVPRFPLRVALRGPLPDRPVALGPEPGGQPLVGEVNAAAAAFGVQAGMRIGEAIARCPMLQLATADPGSVADAADALVRRLESLGAAVEPVEPGTALFAGDGLVRLHGGTRRLLETVSKALPGGGRVGAAAGRFTARVAAGRARPGRPVMISEAGTAEFLSRLTVDRLGLEPVAADEMVALGVRTAGELAVLPLPAVADRFGAGGISAWRLARGEDEAHICPRTPPEPLRESIGFPEPIGDEVTLRQAVAVLVERLLGSPRRGTRPVRSLALTARLGDGGSWRRPIVLRDATSEPRRLRDALMPKLVELPGAVERISLELTELGHSGGDQQQLLRPQEEVRRERAAEAARQVRAGMGEGHLLRVVEVAPWSRIPEGRSLLVPFVG
jgi:protein ImuB